jgi:3-ketosteroid 9alpha-monooxygenase subunit B
MAHSEGGDVANTVTAVGADPHMAVVDVETVSAAEADQVPPEGFAPLVVKTVVRETADAASLVLEVPADWSHRFHYQAGQFLTVRAHVDGETHLRCYSMSSSPLSGEDLRITVKRDRDGVVSNWLNDHVGTGDQIHAAPPAGRFVLRDTERDLVAFAGGSGVTPVFSLIRSALIGTTRNVSLLYANRGRDAVIFADALQVLADRHRGRFTLVHHLDEDGGILTPATIESLIDGTPDADFYVCGPAPFMDTVESTLLASGAQPNHVHLERFSVAETAPAGAEPSATTDVSITLERTTVVERYRPGNTVLQTARMAGLRAPASCETGSCGTCIAQVVQGSARMLNNDALDEDEVADGLILTCQALPTSPTLSVIYE